MQLVRYAHSPVLHAVSSEQTFAPGTSVVVQGQRGPELAIVRGSAEDAAHRKATSAGAARPAQLLRAATADDLAQAQRLSELAEDIKWALRAQARAQNLAVKIVSVELTLDESLLTLSYSAADRLNLRGLIPEIRAYTSARVNFVAVGAREQAVVLGALGACGRENCSSRFLQELPPVTIRMARDQQLPLNPDKLSGPCGRLMCCLQYEHPMYLDLLGELPRRGARMCHTATGSCGKVTKLHPLAGQVDLATNEGGLEGVPATELEPQRGSGWSPGRRSK